MKNHQNNRAADIEAIRELEERSKDGLLELLRDLAKTLPPREKLIERINAYFDSDGKDLLSNNPKPAR